MNHTSLFNFIVDKDAHKVTVERSFNANRDMTWSAWTEPEILDRWWAPKPWTSRTKSMNFSVGGQRLYAMVSPEGDEHWSLMHYTAISPKINFSYRDGFCDSEGTVNQSLPSSNWVVTFDEITPENTVVTAVIQHESLQDLETIIQMGFKEGFSATLQVLDNLLSAKQSNN